MWLPPVRRRAVAAAARGEEAELFQLLPAGEEQEEELPIYGEEPWRRRAVAATASG